MNMDGSGTTAIYARISLDRQDGAGIKRQLEDGHALVKKNGWEPAREFVDNNTSAYSGKPRPHYEEMLEAVRAGRMNRIVVYNLDRLYRQPKELEEIIDLGDHGRVSVVTCNGGDLGLGNTEGDGVFMARLLVNVANKASRDTSRRVKRAKQQAREQGRPSGGVRAFGWKDGMVPEPGEAAALSAAVDAILGGASMADITRQWNRDGVVQPQTHIASWTPANLRQLLRNPRHAGLMATRPVIVVNGKERYGPPEILGKALWPEIIDRDRFERLQAVLDHRGAAGRVPRRRSLLTGLIICKVCGATMARANTKGKAGTRYVWRCPSRQARPGRQKACGGVAIDATGLEALMTEATLQRADTPALAKLLAGQGRQGKESSRLMAELAAIDQRLDAATASYEKGRLPLRALEKVTAAADHDRVQLQRRLGAMTATNVAAPFVGRKGALRKAWPTLTVDQRRAVIQVVLGEAIVAPAIKGPGRRGFDENRVKLKRGQTR